MNVEVYGTGSTAVLAHDGATVHLSRLSADGGGAVTTQGDVRISKGDFLPVKILFRQGDTGLLPHIQNRYFATPFVIDDVLQWAMVDWDTEAINGINTKNTGEKVINGAPAWDWLADAIEGEPSLIVDVRDRDTPCIWFVDKDFIDVHGGLGFVPAYRIHFWVDDGRSFDDVILWLSDDDGENWTDITNDPNIMLDYTTGCFVINADMLIVKDLLFAIEVPDAGVSNIMRFYPRFYPGASTYIWEDGGGDRSGTDRVGWDLWTGLAFVLRGGDGNPDDGNPSGDNGNVSTGDPVSGGTRGNNAVQGIIIKVIKTESSDDGTATEKPGEIAGDNANGLTPGTHDVQQDNPGIIERISVFFNPVVYADDDAITEGASVSVEEPGVALASEPVDPVSQAPTAQPEIGSSGLSPYAAAGAALTCAAIAAGVLFRRVKLRGIVK
jgi:hypothetical protein